MINKVLFTLLQRITKRADLPGEDSDGAKESSETEDGVRISRLKDHFCFIVNICWVKDYNYHV